MGKVIEENKLYPLTCKYCKHEFSDYFDVLDYEHTSGACCPKCGQHIEVEFDAKGNILTN